MYGQEGIKMFYAGIDTHLLMHEVAVIDEKGESIWSGRIGNDRAGFLGLLNKLKNTEESRGDWIAGIYMNPTGSYHMPISHFLREKGYPVYEINPIITSSIRSATNMGRNKSDRVDAFSLAVTGLYHKGSRNHERADASVLTRYRQKLVEEMTRLLNFLEGDLAATFPEMLKVMDMRKRGSLRLVQEFPSPSQYRNNRERIAEILRVAGRGHFDKKKVDRLIELASETIGIGDPKGFYSMRISETSIIIQRLMDSIEKIDDAIEDEMGDNDDVKNLDSIRGINITTASSIVSEIGDIKQFDSEEKLQSYGGKAPSQSSSAGHIQGTWMSKVSNPYLSATVSIAARSLVWNRSPEFFAIYEREIRKGKAKKMAYMVVGKRLLHHVFSIMKNRKPYRQRIPNNGGNTNILDQWSDVVHST